VLVALIALEDVADATTETVPSADVLPNDDVADVESGTDVDLCLPEEL